MVKFSLICPTRHRIKPLKHYIKSVLDTTNNPSSIEMIFIYDNDDINTLETLQFLKEEYKILNISFYGRERSEWNNEDYYNFGAKKAIGKFIWINADDLIFLVPNWDLIIWEKLNAFLINKPDRLVCANIFDSTPGPGNPPAGKEEFPCFPMFSREVLEILGFVLSPQLPTWGADRYAYLLFTKIKRFLVIDDVCYLDHVSYHTKVMEADEITTRAGEICAKYAVYPEHSFHKQGPTIEKQAIFLKEYINGKQ